jgi:type II secretory pathway component GspD/PulD (secretin)
LGDQVPIISVRETDTLVRVRQGETIVIAGLMQDRANVDTAKVPLIGDVPVVGNLFKRTEKSRRKTDLVILLTPTVMGPGETTATTAREIQRLEDARTVAKAR